MSSPDLCAPEKELNHEGTKDTKDTKIERPAAGGASRHADENGRRNTKQIGENVCVAPAVSVRGARFAGPVAGVPLRAPRSPRLDVFVFFVCFVFLRIFVVHS